MRTVADDKVIMGIDPGTNIMGYAFIGVNGNRARLITMGVIDMADFVGNHRRQFIGMLAIGNQGAVNGHLSPGHGPGIDLFAIHHVILTSNSNYCQRLANHFRNFFCPFQALLGINQRGVEARVSEPRTGVDQSELGAHSRRP